MSVREVVDPDDDPYAEKAFLEFIMKLGENGAQIIRGIYSTPFTAVPFTIMILAAGEKYAPGITNKFLAALGQFFSMIGTTAYQALLAVGKDLESIFGQPGPGQTITVGSGKFCVVLTINSALQTAINLGLVPGAQLLPTAGQTCFGDQASADQFYTAITQKVNSTPFAWAVRVEKNY